MDEVLIWSVKELEQLLRSETDDGSIVSVTLAVEMNVEERGIDG